MPKINLQFNDKQIPFKDFDSGKKGPKLYPSVLEWFEKTRPGESVGNCIRRHGFKERLFSYRKVNPNQPLLTIAASPESGEFRHDGPYRIHDEDLIYAGSFPNDYDFRTNKIKYLIGMSVPPIMTARIADEIYNQWLNNL
jgi:DNA (cytosine-5)-methyltransferase 1